MFDLSRLHGVIGSGSINIDGDVLDLKRKIANMQLMLDTEGRAVYHTGIFYDQFNGDNDESDAKLNINQTKVRDGIVAGVSSLNLDDYRVFKKGEEVSIYDSRNFERKVIKDIIDNSSQNVINRKIPQTYISTSMESSELIHVEGNIFLLVTTDKELNGTEYIKLYKSIDGCHSWEVLAHTQGFLESLTNPKVAISPTKDEIILTGTSGVNKIFIFKFPINLSINTKLTEADLLVNNDLGVTAYVTKRYYYDVLYSLDGEELYVVSQTGNANCNVNLTTIKLADITKTHKVVGQFNASSYGNALSQLTYNSQNELILIMKPSYNYNTFNRTSSCVALKPLHPDFSPVPTVGINKFPYNGYHSTYATRLYVYPNIVIDESDSSNVVIDMYGNYHFVITSNIFAGSENKYPTYFIVDKYGNQLLMEELNFLKSDFKISTTNPRIALNRFNDVFLTFSSIDTDSTYGDVYHIKKVHGIWSKPVKVSDDDSVNKLGYSLYHDPNYSLTFNEPLIVHQDTVNSELDIVGDYNIGDVLILLDSPMENNYKEMASVSRSNFKVLGDRRLTIGDWEGIEYVIREI